MKITKEVIIKNEKWILYNNMEIFKQELHIVEQMNH